MLLTLELTGDDTQTATRTFTLAHALSFTKCTLHSVEMSLRGDPLVQDWTDTQTGAYPDGVSRTVHAPIYLELGGLYDSSNVQTYTSTSPTTLIPLGAAEGANGLRAEPRVLDYVLYDGTGVSLEANDDITMQLYYRSVESGVYGGIAAFDQNSFEDDCRCTVTLLLE